MQRLHLSAEELSETIERARVLARHGPDGPILDADVDAYVSAAEEVGVPREAFLHALRERLQLHQPEFQVGDRVFAPSADGHWYLAELLAVAGPAAQVRFLSGAQHQCAAAELRSGSLIPGRKVQVDWPGWGWYSTAVIRLDERKGRLKAGNNWGACTVPLEKVRLTATLANPSYQSSAERGRRPWAVLAWVAAAAGVAGYLVGQLVPFLDHLIR